MITGRQYRSRSQILSDIEQEQEDQTYPFTTLDHIKTLSVLPYHREILAAQKSGQPYEHLYEKAWKEKQSNPATRDWVHWFHNTRPELPAVPPHCLELKLCTDWLFNNPERDEHGDPL
jgi:hypothetical protein